MRGFITFGCMLFALDTYKGKRYAQYIFECEFAADNNTQLINEINDFYRKLINIKISLHDPTHTHTHNFDF